MSGIGDGGHQIAFKFGFVWDYMGWGNSRVASTRRRCSGQLTAMTRCVIVVRTLTLAVMRVLTLHLGSCGVFARGGTREDVIMGACSVVEGGYTGRW